MMPLDSPINQGCPCSSLYFKMDERDIKGGRKYREIELEMRFMEERMEYDEHNNIFTKGKNFFYKK